MTTPDPRLHGPPRCPVAAIGCEACSGFHHWLSEGFDPDEDPPGDDEPTRTRVVAWDILHGTKHAVAFFACKHCDAWAESDYVFELGFGEETQEN